jgi:NadR type nicotinamide-nucleotide adenylyltransferase
MRTKTGLILGKFMPPHNGHKYLINFAQNYPGVDKLYVVVDRLENEPIRQALRVKWLQEMFPKAVILPLGDLNYQSPEDAPSETAFWEQWKKSLKNAIPEDIDYCFNSEDYGWKLAEVLGATHVPVDRGRENFPISATEIRKSAFQHWEQIPKEVRPYFTKKVTIVGAESTGKSTLAFKLAAHFNTVAVPEYARLFLEALAEKKQARSTDYNDITIFADGQKASEQSLLPEANRVLFCDTDAVTTKVWSETLYGRVPDSVIEHIMHEKSDLYLLANVDVAWRPDIHRQWEDESKQERRIAFQNRLKSELLAQGRSFVEITGSDYNNRFEQAKRAVLKAFPDLSRI